MNASNMPGFTAESSLGAPATYYRVTMGPGHLGLARDVVPQMSTRAFRDASGPWSGSCGCGPGFCCCILCYFNECTFWCWLTEVAP